ncbi:MAG TPA: glycosyltransferase family 1 protein, partial [Opitutae bacterium]|nr:glycosyltransferase family 1 protein [Opitutae bacterium]
LQRAHAITCISQKTQQDLIETLKISREKTSVTYMGLNHSYSPMPKDEAQLKIKTLLPELFDSKRPYILHVGSDAWYKNRTGALHIYQALQLATRSEDRMVFVGPPPNKLMQILIKNYKISDRVFFIEKASNEELCALYSNAELLLHPSFEEGFGWPILEALACGCRVATTNCAPMTEIGGTAAQYIPKLDPNETKDIASWAHNCAAHIAGMIAQDPDERKALCELGVAQAKKFSTDTMIDNYIQLYESIISA